MVRENTSDTQGAFFEVPAKHKGQKPILFGRVESEAMTCEKVQGENLNLHNSFIIDENYIT